MQNIIKKRFLSFLLIISFVFSLASCKGSPVSDVPGSVRIFTDDCGRNVELPEQITKIAASGPLSQIILFAIAPEMFVGLASAWSESASGIIPEKYFSLPYFGQLYGSANLNVEALASAGPELIIDVGEPKKSIVEDMDNLQFMSDIPSVHIDASLSTMPEAFRKLGKLLGKESKAEKLAEYCERIYTRTEEIMNRVGNSKVRALYITGEEGLNVFAKTSFPAELIDMLVDNLAVVENPSGKGIGNEVTMEQILLWNPDFIIFSPQSIYSSVSESETWKLMSAVQQGKYVETPSVPHCWTGAPSACQRFLGMIWLTALLYPDYCEYDVKEDIKEYFSLFYDADLSDEQYDTIMRNAF